MMRTIIVVAMCLSATAAIAAGGLSFMQYHNNSAPNGYLLDDSAGFLGEGSPGNNLVAR